MLSGKGVWESMIAIDRHGRRDTLAASPLSELGFTVLFAVFLFIAAMASKETSIKVGLDWTPVDLALSTLLRSSRLTHSPPKNPLHAGLFVAQAKGYYSSAGLAVSLVSPSADGYATTPGKKVSTGELDLCLCPSETVISFQSSPSAQARIKACAALLSRDASAIVSRTATRPAELVGEGKQYASYGARYEDAIVQAMIDRDAGENKVGKLKTVTPAKLGIWETVIKGKCDSTWIFEPFEGERALYSHIKSFDGADSLTTRRAGPKGGSQVPYFPARRLRHPLRLQPPHRIQRGLRR